MPIHRAALWVGALSLVSLSAGLAAQRPSPTPAHPPTATSPPAPGEAVLLYPAPPPAPPQPPAPPEPAARPTPPRPSGELEVHFIDVGQSDATLLRAPDATVLIDTGRHDRSDVADYLHQVGVTTIDVVAVTHPHADHLGQFAQILQAHPVTEVWWSGATHTTATFDRALSALEASDASYTQPRAGQATTVGSLLVEFLNPPAHAALADLHDSSLAMRVTYGQVTVLFTGDAEAATEARMLAAHPDLLAADVYQVGHHGSATSTTPAFLAAVDPSVAMYSAGAGNPYGHPDQAVIDRLDAADVAVYGTDHRGTVVVTTDGTALTATTQSDTRPVTPSAPGDPQSMTIEPRRLSSDKENATFHQ